MPFIRRLPTQDDEAKQAQTLQPQRASGSLAPAGSAPPSGPVGGGRPTSAPGGSFVNLVDYVNANKGAGNAMADKVLGKTEQAGNALMGAGAAKPAPMASAAASPTQQAMQSQGLALKQLAGQNAVDTAAQTETNAGLAGTWGGRQDLLQQQTPTATQGELNLDNALMGQAAGARLQDAARRFGGLTDFVRGRENNREAMALDQRTLAAAAAARAKADAEEEARKAKYKKMVADNNKQKTTTATVNAVGKGPQYSSGTGPANQGPRPVIPKR